MTDYPRIDGPRHELAYDDRRFPASIRALSEPPKRIYVLGSLDALETDRVAVIGARKATPYGIACAEMAAQCAHEHGIGLISGAAIGCDQAAQREGVRLGVPVSAVLGSGADVVYPPSAKDLLERIVAGGGAVVSILPWGSSPARGAFVRRNAVIAALSRLLVICEAGLPSGTTTTARYAHELDRAVAAFPGSIFSPNSRGANDLIFRTEALPVCDRESLGFIYSSVFGTLGSAAPADDGRHANEPPDLRSRIVGALLASPSPPGELAVALGRPSIDLLRELSAMEVAGVVCRMSDGRYALTEREYLRHNT